MKVRILAQGKKKNRLNILRGRKLAPWESKLGGEFPNNDAPKKRLGVYLNVILAAAIGKTGEVAGTSPISGYRSRRSSESEEARLGREIADFADRSDNI